ncbi:MAG: cation diffusion facilitator family transporter [Caulobacterales bacterium]|jgi:cation diffusion facilitator family transporter
MAADSIKPRLTSAEASAITRRIALASVAVAVVLIVLKAWAWFASGSVAMLSSLADSVLDFAASLFTYFAVRYAATPPDGEHRYGHGKAEAFAGLFQAGLVAVSAALILVEAARRIAAPEPVRAGEESLVVMGLSILLTSALVLAQSRAIAQTGSVATKGDREHYAADLTSNIVVVFGIAAGHFLGWSWADAAAGILVACWLALGAYEVARESADHLMDRELPDEDRARIEALARDDPAILGVHDLRTRSSGPFIHIQFHADLDPEISLKAAHEVVVAAEARIRTAYPAADVIIHPDPADGVDPHGHEAFLEGRAARAR